MAAAAHRFAVCTACGHGAVARSARAACRLCGAPLAERAAPATLFAGWRCACAACRVSPC
ncbi:MAG TPA: hypothetical protein VM889_14235 [Candidatus Thermoplasmatota archaeon]|nr:hypothetical protein [Candidatus Thermoplasmatota archaeon]